MAHLAPDNLQTAPKKANIMSDTGVSARKSAVFLLDQILGEGKLMSELLGAGVLDRLAPEDRARAQRLLKRPADVPARRGRDQQVFGRKPCVG